MPSSFFLPDILARLPSSSSLPGPTATTLPICGFSLAVSGRIIPPAVFSSASDCLITILSSRGLRFITHSLSIHFHLLFMYLLFDFDNDNSINRIKRFRRHRSNTLFTASTHDTHDMQIGSLLISQQVSLFDLVFKA